MLTTRPVYVAPSSAVGGSRMSSMRRRASVDGLAVLGADRHRADDAVVADTDTSAPVSWVIVLMTLPFGPITSPILSIGISKLMIFGAVGRTSSRGSEIVARP